MDILIFTAGATGLFFLLSLKKYPQLRKKLRERKLEEDYFKRMSRR
jgi:hypothetical protein